jgi:hypothetical protein
MKGGIYKINVISREVSHLQDAKREAIEVN